MPVEERPGQPPVQKRGPALSAAPARTPPNRYRAGPRKSEWPHRLGYFLVALAVVFACVLPAAPRDPVLWGIIAALLATAVALNWKDLLGRLQSTKRTSPVPIPSAPPTTSPAASTPAPESLSIAPDDSKVLTEVDQAHRSLTSEDSKVLAEPAPALLSLAPDDSKVLVEVDPAHRSLTSDDTKVLAEVERLGSRKADWKESITVLVLSVAAFFGLGLLKNPLLDIAVIVGVILFHELGHYLGMRLFGFKDVRMFFIPFFGAAVSGTHLGVPSYKRALVTLLGPVPGLVLGVSLGVASIVLQATFLWHLAVLFFVINAFNLLPFLPLDGGRLLHEVLLQRNRHVEAAFRVLSGGALAAYGLHVSAWVLAGLGVMVILSAGLAFRQAGVAVEARLALAGEPSGPVTKLPPEQAAGVIAAVRRAFPGLRKPSELAVRVEAVWDRLTSRPPGWLATLGFLAFYGACVLTCAALYAGAVYASRQAPAVQPPESGETRHWSSRPTIKLDSASLHMAGASLIPGRP